MLIQPIWRGSSCGEIPYTAVNIATWVHGRPATPRPKATGSEGVGGSTFAADPNTDSRTPVHWSTAVFPRVLTVVPTTHRNSHALDLSDVGGITHRLDTRVCISLAEDRFYFEGWTPRLASATIAIPLDEYVDIRLAELRRFTHVLLDKGNHRRARFLPDQRHARLVLCARALDGWLLGNTYRMIAEHLFGSHRLPESGWKTHDLRSRTIRLVEDGKTLMNARYLDLLQVTAKS